MIIYVVTIAWTEGLERPLRILHIGSGHHCLELTGVARGQYMQRSGVNNGPDTGQS